MKLCGSKLTFLITYFSQMKRITIFANVPVNKKQGRRSNILGLHCFSSKIEIVFTNYV